MASEPNNLNNKHLFLILLFSIILQNISFFIEKDEDLYARPYCNWNICMKIDILRAYVSECVCMVCMHACMFG